MTFERGCVYVHRQDVKHENKIDERMMINRATNYEKNRRKVGRRRRTRVGQREEGQEDKDANGEIVVEKSVPNTHI